MERIINGKKIAQDLVAKCKHCVSVLQAKHNTLPKLVILMIGNNEASKVYVKNKLKRAEKVNIEAKLISLNDNVSFSDIENIIVDLNNDDSVNGIVVQRPLPNHINVNDVSSLIKIEKDVDGLHPINIGSFILSSENAMIPCTALACLSIIKSVIYDLSGKNIVIIGRSKIVGLPLSILLNQKNATVTLCHSYTKSLASISKKADIVVTAVGKAKYFGCEYFKKDACVVDVGINLLDKSFVGDVDFDQVVNNIRNITPVPGGVGPVTVAYLLANTIKSFCLMKKDNLYKGLY